MKSIFDDLNPQSETDILPSSDEQPTAPSRRALTARTISRQLLTSDSYLASLKRRIATDSLPAAVECKLYDYAWGKPVEKVEIKDTSNDLAELSAEALEARTQMLLKKLAEVRDAGMAQPEQQPTDQQPKAVLTPSSDESKIH